MKFWCAIGDICSHMKIVTVYSASILFTLSLAISLSWFMIYCNLTDPIRQIAIMCLTQLNPFSPFIHTHTHTNTPSQFLFATQHRVVIVLHLSSMLLLPCSWWFGWVTLCGFWIERRIVGVTTFGNPRRDSVAAHADGFHARDLVPWESVLLAVWHRWFIR